MANQQLDVIILVNKHEFVSRYFLSKPGPMESSKMQLQGAIW